MSALKTAPRGLAKIASVLEQLDKEAAPISGAIPLRHAAAYGGLGGLGLYGGKKLLSGVSGSPDPEEMGESALGTAGKAAVGGIALAGLLNILNKLTRR